MAILNSTFGPGLFGTGMRTADFRDQGFQNLPGFGGGINLPININNNPFSNPIQDGMFRPPMQQPVQNQMPVAGSFLDQLQQSTQSLNNQIRNVVPQNSFVGNEFQMPFKFGGSSYSPGNFTYTPQPFNQYGNMFGFNLPSLNQSGIGGLTPIQDREGYQGERQFPGSYESFGGLNFSIDEFGVPTQVEGTPLTSPLLGLLSSVSGLIPGNEASRFENLDETTQKQIFGLLDEEAKKKLAGAVDTNVTRDFINKGLISQLSPAEQERLALTDEERNIISKKSGYGLFGLGTPSEAERAKALQEQQDARDLQKQAEKQRQANLAAFNERQKAQQEKEGKDGDGPTGGCFVEGTPIQMADGTTKEITNIELGEKTKGGIVEAKMQFLPQNIYNYKDVLVSGSHWVVEDNQLIAVEDSKHGVLTDRIEPVYTFKTSNNRIWINNIEFGDFETGSDADWEPHFESVRQKLNKELRDGK